MQLLYILPPKGLKQFSELTIPSDDNVVFCKLCLPYGTEFETLDTQQDVIGAYLTLGETFDHAMQNSKQLTKKIIVNNQYPG